ncbi:hypothetical protein ACOMHN_040828 [Nucella lapillus]
MVLLSPPDKEPTGAELERILTALDKQDLKDMTGLDLLTSDDLDLVETGSLRSEKDPFEPSSRLEPAEVSSR